MSHAAQTSCAAFVDAPARPNRLRMLLSARAPPGLQSLLQAVGVGAKRSLPAAATINWVLKDGLGRLGRLTVATRFGESFDSDLKVRAPAA